jgi:antigen flippase
MSNKKSYSQILNSSSIMGGVAGVTMILGMVRMKFAAMLIGTIGVGLNANFLAIQNFIGTIAGLGIEQSAVRDVAKAMGQNNWQTIGYTILTLRRMCWLSGLLGAGTIALLSPLLSQWTFDSKEYVLDIAALGLVILFVNLKGGQIAMIQGMRRISDIARIQIIGAIAGTIITIILYLWLGLRGIVPALVLTAAVSLIVSWLFARRVAVPNVVMTWKESFHNAGGMVRLGIAMMWSGLLGSAVIYATNMLITQQINIQAVGIYSAAFALSGMFVNFVLNAMGTDYLPRLSGVTHDKETIKRLVNEQTEIGLLIALPGLLATISLAPWVIKIFYTSEFLPAADLLQWFILGCLGRVIGFPMGYMFVALGKSAWFFFTQTLFNILHIALIWIGLFTFGLVGTSIAFACTYVIGVSVNLVIARHLNGFHWYVETKRLVIMCLSFVIFAFVAVRSMSIWPATIFGIAVTMVATIFCLKELVKRLGTEHRVVRAAFKVPGMRLVCGCQRVN